MTSLLLHHAGKKPSGKFHDVIILGKTHDVITPGKTHDVIIIALSGEGLHV